VGAVVGWLSPDAGAAAASLRARRETQIALGTLLPPMTSATSPSPTPAAPALDRRRLNIVLLVGVIDALLLVVLVYVAFVNRSDAAVHVLGPVHGLGYLVLLGLTANGAVERRWGWWFPALVLVTGGPVGTIAGDVVLRRRLPAVSAA
jgi:hypothetical protein